LSTHDFVPGQCWISDTEADLGIGLVKACDQRRVTVLFPAVGEERTYACANAPLSRVRYGVEDWINTVDGRRLMVRNVLEHEGRLQYETVDEAGQPAHIVEAELDSFVQFNRPQDRLLAGQIDKNSDFELRVDTLRQRHRHQGAESFGLLGPRVQLLPHQLYIASEVARRHAPRVLLADEVGLGKTIEAGLIIHQQLAAGRISRVLVLTPDTLALQWLVEMLRRFNLRFTVLDEDRCDALEESGEDNPFETAQLIISALSLPSRSTKRTEQAAAAGWDLLVVDEAHHLRWSEAHTSIEYDCVAQLATASAGLLLLTATPEQLGVDGHFARLRLLDPARYPNLQKFQSEQGELEPVRRLVDALSGLGFARRDTELAPVIIDLEGYGLTISAKAMVEAQTDAAFQAAVDEAVESLLDRHGTGRVLFRNTRDAVGGFAERRLVRHNLPVASEVIETLQVLPLAEQLRPEIYFGVNWVGSDPRVEWLSEWLSANREEKVLVICAAADSAATLEEHVRLRTGIRTTCFHQGMSLVARDRAAAYFADKDEGAQALICSEIGSEGRNFQFASHLVLFDLPLNPDLLEQRIGRLDRIGQKRTVQIHVPCFQGTAQGGLLRWYHDGLNAFERSCPVGQSIIDTFGERLKCCLAEVRTNALDQLISETRVRTDAFLAELRAGRDRLLELNSCHPVRSAHIAEAAAAEARPSELSAYLDRVFDHFGLDCERHSINSIVLKPGNHMTVSSFPGLPEDGLTATYQRAEALEREDMQYFTWEHPLVVGAQDLILNGDLGNTALCSASIGGVREGSIVVECYFALVCPAPKSFQLGRYLPDALVRLLMTNSGGTRQIKVAAEDLDRVLERVPTRVAQQVVKHARDDIQRLVSSADEAVTGEQDQLVDQALETAQSIHRQEIERLQALAAVNPNLRPEEIERERQQLADVHAYISAARLQLEGLRVIVAT